jgi:hypothetical protein
VLALRNGIATEIDPPSPKALAQKTSVSTVPNLGKAIAGHMVKVSPPGEGVGRQGVAR